MAIVWSLCLASSKVRVIDIRFINLPAVDVFGWQQYIYISNTYYAYSTTRKLFRKIFRYVAA